MTIVAVIPAHLASVRFPEKVLFDFYGLPMIEHVRRRALMSESLNSVIVATPDEKIANVVSQYGGQVVMTSNKHTNGTTRVAEAVSEIDCSHVLLLQGDEPLLLPEHVDSMIKATQGNSESSAWNATADINSEDELNRHSFVKCAIHANRILHCFRKTPYFSEFSKQKLFVRKILGLIAYKKEFLLELSKMNSTPIETAELIEQMRIIEYGHILQSVPVDASLPSVNEPHEAEIVNDYIQSSSRQQKLLDKVLNDY